jgi:hypothetical protein
MKIPSVIPFCVGFVFIAQTFWLLQKYIKKSKKMKCLCHFYVKQMGYKKPPHLGAALILIHIHLCNPMRNQTIFNFQFHSCFSFVHSWHYHFSNPCISVQSVKNPVYTFPKSAIASPSIKAGQGLPAISIVTIGARQVRFITECLRADNFFGTFF